MQNAHMSMRVPGLPLPSSASSLLSRQGTGAVSSPQIWCHSWPLAAPAGEGVVGAQQRWYAAEQSPSGHVSLHLTPSLAPLQHHFLPHLHRRCQLPARCLTACKRAHLSITRPTPSPLPMRKDSPTAEWPARPARPTICRYWERATGPMPCRRGEWRDLTRLSVSYRRHACATI